MKKLIALALALVMALALTVPALAAEEDAETLTVGGLSHLGIDEEEFHAELDDMLADLADALSEGNGSFQYTYYPSC